MLEYLGGLFAVTVCYDNPNIYPEAEYKKRLSEQKRLCEILNVPLIEAEYDHEKYLLDVRGLENEPEGGRRCEVCIGARMERAAAYAKENGFDYFTTTLSVSPHKDAAFINRKGEEIEKRVGVPYYYADFKKKDGYLRSIRLSEKYGLYRQSYCGCEFAKREE